MYEADLREGKIAEKGTSGDLKVLQHDIGPTEMPAALMSAANLERAKLSGAIAIQADFTNAIMRNCKMTRANLRRAKFSGANLENADLRGCDLAGADLKGAILVGTRFEFATLDGSDMTGALTDALSGKSIADLPDTIEIILAAHARWGETSGREGRPADFSGFDLRSLKGLPHATLTALIAPDAVFYGLDLTGARLQGAQLEGADLRGCKLTGADLRGANLRGAKLATDLRDVNLGPC
jgi:uncharacterized protein YjbI with pentapeptide repeats